MSILERMLALQATTNRRRTVRSPPMEIKVVELKDGKDAKQEDDDDVDDRKEEHSQSSVGRWFAATWNIPTHLSKVAYLNRLNVAFSQDIFTGVIYDIQIGHKKQTLHAQITCGVNKPMRLNALHKLLKTNEKKHGPGGLAGCYIRPARNGKNSWNYCLNDPKKTRATTLGFTRPFIIGVPPSQGIAHSFEEVRKIAERGATDKELYNADPDLFAHRGRVLKEIRDMHYTERTQRPTVIIRWGPTGTGKTHAAVQESKTANETYYVVGVNQGLIWWNEYAQQKHVILDDYHVGDLGIGELLRLLDKYPTHVKATGARKIPFNSPKVTITMHHDPYIVFGDRWPEIEGRCTKVVHHVTPYASTDRPRCVYETV